MRLGLHLASGRDGGLTGAAVLPPPDQGGDTAAPQPDWSPAPLAASEAAAGFHGHTRYDAANDRTYFDAGKTVWVGQIRGSEAVLGMGTNWGQSHAQFAHITVDGVRSPGLLPMTNGELTLFSGLADEAHLVSVDLSEAFGTAAYIPGAGPGLTVAGEAPEALLPAYRYHFARPDVVTGTALTDHPSSDGFEPARVLDRSPGTGSMFPSMGLRGSFSELIFTVRPPASPVSVYVSVDGGDPLRLDPTSGVARYVPEPGEHSYCIWTDATGRTLVVGTNEAADLAYQPPRLFAIGHSITEGVAAGDEDGVLRLASFTDLPMTAARNGYVPGISGIGGNRVDHAAARIDGVLSKMTIAPQDVAIVDLGRNDSSLDGQAATDYHAILDSLKARGFGRILCLSVMYDGTAFDGLNQQMRDIISSRNDSSIIYIDRDHYTPANGVTAPDGVHPDRAGYLAMNELNKAAIDPYLP